MNKIKFPVFLLLAILFIASCKDEEQVRRESLPAGPKILEKDSKYYDQNYRIYELNGCEYIVVSYGNQQWGSHKGDCKNPIHKCPCDTIESK